MAYQALYRRYRPQRFEDFVGQEAVIHTLAAQVMSGRIAHAYLFCGTRGTGKTSAAKVFARAINCEHPQNGDPCGQCAVCRALSGEGSLDILEIDAASNNGVDEIRELRENIKYPPRDGRYRVYIIDEVHMLSTGAFNALLKTLEEPPSHAKFILATTEPQKLPATILSRCQRFDFGRIAADRIAARLDQAMREDGIAAEPAALHRIARAAEGGMRDAWSIADMCLGYAQEQAGGLTDALVREVLGAADGEFLFRFVGALLSGDAAGALCGIDEMMRAGREVAVFLRDISAHLRALTLAQLLQEETGAVLDIPQEDAERYRRQAAGQDPVRLMALTELFLRAEGETRWSAQPRFVLEASALRACQPKEELQLAQLQERVALLEQKLREGVTLSARASAPAPKPEAEPAPPAAPKAAPKAQAPKQADASAEAIWRTALAALRRDPMLYGLAMNGKLASVSDGLYTVAFPQASGAIHVNMLSDPERQQKIEAALSEAAGAPCRFCAALEGDTVSQAQRAAEKKKAQEGLDKVFDVFGRENVRVIE